MHSMGTNIHMNLIQCMHCFEVKTMVLHSYNCQINYIINISIIYTSYKPQIKHIDCLRDLSWLSILCRMTCFFVHDAHQLWIPLRSMEITQWLSLSNKSTKTGIRNLRMRIVWVYQSITVFHECIWCMWKAFPQYIPIIMYTHL